MKNIILIILAIIFVFMVVNGFSYTRIEKIGVVDLNELFDKYVENKDIAVNFNNYKKTSLEKIETYKRELLELRSKITQLSNKVLLLTNQNGDIDLYNPDVQELKKVSNDYELKFKEYLSYVENVENTLSAMRNELRKYVIKDLLTYVKNYGDKNGYTLILEQQTGKIIYISPSSDITQDMANWIKKEESAKKKF